MSNSIPLNISLIDTADRDGRAPNHSNGKCRFFKVTRSNFIACQRARFAAYVDSEQPFDGSKVRIASATASFASLRQSSWSSRPCPAYQEALAAASTATRISQSSIIELTPQRHHGDWLPLP